MNWCPSMLPGIRDLHAIDLFSGDCGRVAEAVKRRGFRACVFDIRKGGLDHDVVSATGFRNLILIALRLMAGGLIVLGPPCSLFVWLSSSQHLRHLYGPEGRPLDSATQLANQIAKNTVA